MKFKKLLTSLAFVGMSLGLFAQNVDIDTVYTGASANDGTGDNLREAIEKLNSNDQNLYEHALSINDSIGLFGDTLREHNLRLIALENAPSGGGDVSWGTLSGEQPVIIGDGSDIDNQTSLTYDPSNLNLSISTNTGIPVIGFDLNGSLSGMYPTLDDLYLFAEDDIIINGASSDFRITNLVEDNTLTDIVVLDNNGVSHTRDASTLGGGSSVITDLTGTPNTVVYVDASGDVQTLAIGTNGQLLASNGTSVGFINPPSGGGDVSVSGDPTLGQLAKWINGTTIEGVAFPFDSASLSTDSITAYLYSGDHVWALTDSANSPSLDTIFMLQSEAYSLGAGSDISLSLSNDTVYINYTGEAADKDSSYVQVSTDIIIPLNSDTVSIDGIQIADSTVVMSSVKNKKAAVKVTPYDIYENADFALLVEGFTDSTILFDATQNTWYNLGNGRDSTFSATLTWGRNYDSLTVSNDSIIGIGNNVYDAEATISLSATNNDNIQVRLMCGYAGGTPFQLCIENLPTSGSGLYTAHLDAFFIPNTFGDRLWIEIRNTSSNDDFTVYGGKIKLIDLGNE